jgi:hypothetical protein
MIDISVLDLQSMRLVETSEKKKTHPIEGGETGNDHAGGSTLTVVACA